MYQRYPCPCCGYRVFERQPGGHETCPICGWEDDLAQLRFPLMPGSANTECLQQAQENYAAYGACARSRRLEVRRPFADESRDGEWRPLDERRDNVEQPSRGVAYGDSYPLDDTTVLYYWRATYWRRGAA
jgi:hypothetical protein